jgi:5'-nucleotidase
VHLALTGNFLLSKPDLIVSGINNGANLGDDTIYSGTVAATIEGHLFDVPGMAFSMAGKSEQHYAAGATVARRLVSLFQQKALSGLPLLNVNIPDAPENNIADIMTTRLGRRHAAEPSILLNRDEHTMLYTIGEAGKARDNSIGTDFHAIENGAVSVTPLMVDLTDSAQLGRVWEWLQS